MFLFLITFALTTIRNFDPCAPNSASRSLIFHLIHTISIPLSLAGLFKNSTYASMLLGPATPCDALHSALGIESSRTTAGSGFGMQDTRSTEVIGGVKQANGQCLFKGVI